MLIHPDRLFSADPAERGIARRLYDSIKSLPIISPHGHTDPRWYAENDFFPDPATLFVVPDHYVFRMLYSQGVPLESLGIKTRDGTPIETDSRAIWQRFADHYHLFRGTPTRMWLDHVFATQFDFTERLSGGNAQAYYDRIAERLTSEAFRPRALYETFGIEVISTTDSPIDSLEHHAAVKASGWKGRVVSAYRPDAVIDPQAEGFLGNLKAFAEVSGCDAFSWKGYLEAHRVRRAFFREFGTTSTDHGHPSARTANLGPAEAETLFGRITGKSPVSAEDAELFRAQMLTEMAKMSVDDGMVMQIHPGCWRSHNPALFARFGKDMGADIPTRTDYVGALKPLLDLAGNSRDFSLILFTLDETSYSRELAPLAGHYPCLKLGPAWWFFDSADGMKRYRELTTETAGFYNTVGFNDDTRAYLSIPARHDVARRIDCAFLAERVADHRLDEDEAHEIAYDLTYRLAKEAYKL